MTPLAIMPTKSYDDCLDLCVKLGLIEIMRHGNSEYIRYTEDGINVLAALVGMQANMDMDDVLKSS
jgi:hypothetical protein